MSRAADMRARLAALPGAHKLFTAPPIGAGRALFHHGRALAGASQNPANHDPDTADRRALRDELLARSRAGEHIELILACTPFVQHPHEPNRNFIRFRAKDLAALGSSGVNTVFLRDHRQGQLDARGGTVTSSRMERDADGLHHLRQDIVLHEPWAVQGALTGSIDRFSIGWNPMGPITCSLCKSEILADCWHWPGDTVDAENGDQVVIEWIFHEAELLETSAVCVPAVRHTTVDEIRAALAAQHPSAHPHTTIGRAPNKQRREPMSYARLKARLGLAEDANESEILAALDARERDAATRREQEQTRVTALEAQLDEATRALATERQAHEALRAGLAEKALESFIQAGIQAGKVRPGSKFEHALRALHAMDPDAAREQLEAAPVVTPVGAPRQSDAPAPPEDGPDALTYAQLKSAGIADPNAYFAKYRGAR